MTHATAKRKNRRRAWPPAYAVSRVADVPPPTTRADWTLINWKAVRQSLSKGQALCFRVEPSQLIEFWQLALAQLGAVTVRYAVRRGEFWLWDGVQHAASIAPTPNDTADRKRLETLRAAADRLRQGAVVQQILADSLTHAAEMACRGIDRETADGLFIAEHGAGGYPLEFDTRVFATWVRAVRSRPDMADVFADPTAVLGRPSPDRGDGPRGKDGEA